MDTLLKATKPSSLVFALAALLVLSAGIASSHNTATAQGNGNNAEEFIFGTVGLTPTQTARLNAVNTATDGRSRTRVLKFLDAAGNVIVDSSGNPVQMTVTLAPGQSAYLDLNGADIPGGGRVQIRALDPTCTTCRETPFSIKQTLELIDNLTHRTEGLYAPARFTPPGQSLAGPFGMVGIVDGQTACLSVTAPPGLPQDLVRVVLAFAKSDGQPVLNADGAPRLREVLLQPGESASFDLPADVLLADGETRAQLRPLLLVAETCSTCIPTLEVIETCGTCTGKTAVLYAPVTQSCGGGQ